MDSMIYETVLRTVINGNDLSREQSHRIFTDLMDGKLTKAQIAALLVGLEAKKADINEIAGAAQAMREHAVKIDTAGKDVIDIVGTGGTGISTFNISTTTCFVVAGAGQPVAKHGSVTNARASGSANVLQSLGVNIDLSPRLVTRCLAETNLGFCYAPNHHPAMKYVMPVRKQLPIRTVFNILGPLTNPADAKRIILGVFDNRYTEPLAGALAELGTEKAWVVHASMGLDEIGICGPTRVTELDAGQLRTFTISPADAGLPEGTLDDLRVESPEASADRCRAILDGTETGASRDIVLFNAAAALLVAGQADDLPSGVALARTSIESGAAKTVLDSLIAITN